MKKIMTKKSCAVVTALCLFVAATVTATAQITCSGVQNLAGTMNTDGSATLTWSMPANNIYEEGFEAGIPTNWTNVDADGDNYLWQQATVGTPHSGSGMATSLSYNMGVNLTPDNWLISEPITLSGTPLLNYWVNAQNSSYAAEHYGVYISTTGNEISDFTLLFEETISAKGNGGDRSTTAQGAWYQRTIDVSTYSGVIYVAWRHFNCTGQEALNLDDVTINGQMPLPDLTSYNIFHNESLVATVDASVFTCNVPDAIAGQNSYCVTAQYSDCVSSQSCINLFYVDPGSCSYSVIMHKNMAPTGIGGWEGASIRFFGEDGNILANVTLEDGAEGVEYLVLPQDEEITCMWFPGADDYWINFEIADPVGNIFFEGWPFGFENPLFLTFVSSCSYAVPEIPQNFEVNGNSSSLEATLTWTNPSIDISGIPLTELSSVVIMRNNAIIHTIDNPIVGANAEWIDNTITLPEIYTYNIYVTNSYGPSSMVIASDTVGVFRILPTSGTESVTTCLAAIKNEADYLGLYPSSYDGSIVIYPDNEDGFVSITGTHYIYGGDFGGMADTLYVYDGAGTTGSLLSTYTGSCFDDGKGTLNNVSLTGPLTLHFKANSGSGCRGFNIYTSCIGKAELTGTVTNTDGNVVVGAVVNVGSGLTAITNEMGEYSLNISEGTFNIIFSADGYFDYTEIGYVMGTEPQTLNAVLEVSQFCNPVKNLTGETINNVPTLTWELPVGAGEKELTWSGEYGNNSVGTGQPVDFDVAHKYTVEDVADYVGWTLTKIAFVPCEPTASFSLRAWMGNTQSLVLAQSVPSFNAAQWNEYIIETPVTIEAGQELWIGYNVSTTTGYPAGIDYGPAVAGKGEMMYFGGSWTTLSSLGDFNNNWCIIATVTNAKGKSAKLSLNGGSKDDPAGVLTGYNVYRDNDLLATLGVTTKTYTDENAPEGTFEYCVTAVYENCEAEEVCESITVNLKIEEIENTTIVYPNPADKKLSIKGEDIENVIVYNVFGQMVETTQDKIINTSRYADGIYMVVVNLKSGNAKSYRVVVKH
ncbi:MAG: choice-of-anchor J domain-containing protein [Bacteroidales bacterium]|nr:choice-of-anchor J domain-containing protein [Bacteroidales bacterium]MDD2205043.1 choice-of-anchor J domain-containing protein [Bacteroidales bacterium]MDD3151513.1 choice-of-anchor J domain-containing protein [Bacteroidales bacterium]MDD3914520.1 choice-of-anchor J domain-containing protein [Bacteroidales bacterium]MDD4634380.1 choice-of-anchor J domain-containing protein [Bacteroidales bacterium]